MSNQEILKNSIDLIRTHINCFKKYNGVTSADSTYYKCIGITGFLLTSQTINFSKMELLNDIIEKLIYS